MGYANSITPFNGCTLVERINDDEENDDDDDADLSRWQWILDVALSIVGRILERLLGHFGRLVRFHALARCSRVRDVVGRVVGSSLELSARRSVAGVCLHPLPPLYLPLSVVSCTSGRKVTTSR